MANINNVVNVSLQADQQLALGDSMNVVAIMTSDRTFLNTNKRYAVYSDINEVANDFGSSNDVTAFAQIFFAQQPNPTNAGGELVIGYWRASSETVPATAGYVLGGELNELDVIAQLQQITAGAMTFTVDGVSVPLTNLDFSVIDNMSDVVSVIQTALDTAATVSYDNFKLKITSPTTGVDSTLSFAVGSGENFVGNILSLIDTTGAILVAGAASQTLSAETEVDALTAVKTLINFKGFMFIDQSTPTERYNIAVWSQANNTLGYDVFFSADDLTRVIADSTAWKIKLAGLTNYRMLYRFDNNRKYATAYMSRMHTVNFDANNATITMNLKTLNGITPEDYTQTIINNAKSIGLDLYTSIKNVPVNLCASGNDFVDNRYNLLSYIEDVTVDVFNLLKGTPTKIPQTLLGVNTIVDTIQKTTVRYVNAGVFAPGTWTSPNTFGDLQTFLRFIAQNGYYILAGSLAEQSAAKRQNRESPVIQVAVKNAGAIHSVDIIINFNL